MAEPGSPDARPESDVYTVLVIVATFFLATGTVYVSSVAQSLFGSWMPF